jgi:dethiobiotin synthetase
LFVTGTDTGIGKTLVTAALARFLCQQGLRIGVMKPIETGVDKLESPGADARLLRWAAGSGDADDLIAPYRLRDPLSPSHAAERQGMVIDPTRITAAYTQLSENKDLTLVEGAGGLMVPVRGGYLMADLARQLALPLLVVTRPNLGTINHTLLTIFTARAMELPLAGYVINRMPQHPNVAEEDSPHLLASLASADLLGVLPEVTGTEEERIERLADALAGLPTRSWLMQAIGMPCRQTHG